MIIGKNGELTLPKKIREKFGFHPGSEVEMEINKNGILIKPMEANREEVMRWLQKEHGSELATLTTDEIMRLL